MADHQHEQPGSGELRRRVNSLSEQIKPITIDFERLQQIEAELGELYRAVLETWQG
jgi:coenzyme F420-reducing hydrogenase delta subunit